MEPPPYTQTDSTTCGSVLNKLNKVLHVACSQPLWVKLKVPELIFFVWTWPNSQVSFIV